MPYEQISVHSSPFFSWFSPTHGILCKIYLNVGWQRVQISCFCLIISGEPAAHCTLEMS